MAIETSGMIDAPVEKVWAMVSDFGGLLRWHPHLRSCELSEVDGMPERRVHFKDGERWAVERLIKLNPQARYFEYVIVDAQDPSSIGLGADMTVSACDDGRTQVRWVSAKWGEFSPEVKRQLASYYQERINHLRDAIARNA